MVLLCVLRSCKGLLFAVKISVEWQRQRRATPFAIKRSRLAHSVCVCVWLPAISVEQCGVRSISEAGGETTYFTISTQARAKIECNLKRKERNG